MNVWKEHKKILKQIQDICSTTPMTLENLEEWLSFTKSLRSCALMCEMTLRLIEERQTQDAPHRISGTTEEYKYIGFIGTNNDESTKDNKN